ncbi:DNA replication terminus site-binding protein [Arsenophonus nasoniae]|uniref:DNA replication terminus site-binding protein n=1 Tax=Arsenophonus nasoniae TaxID=638 RepID=A0AA95GDM6_9GAMM|nr:DNA replication terminus site-binding protein [Arsenophonus nasoniae]WGL94255.1 DNA replication terminus site-binding protein [Arsenophonus nasoniae]
MKYDARYKLSKCFDLLKVRLADFLTELNSLSLTSAIVFKLPETKKGDENNDINQITITTLTGDTALDLALANYNRLFIHDNPYHISNKTAIRLPGALCFHLSAQRYSVIKRQLETINKLKTKLKDIVTCESGIKKEQRFEFIHQQLHGLITLNAYRKINYVDSPDSINFGWANKKIVNKVTKAQILERLHKNYRSEKVMSAYTKQQWRYLVEKEIQDINSIPNDAILKIQRPVKVQPIARVWYANEKRQVQYACPLPLLSFSCDTKHLTKLGTLSDYDINNIKIKHKPKNKKLKLIIARLHLYQEI